MENILWGDGDKNHPFIIRNLDGERWEGTDLKEALRLCKEAGIIKLKVAYSGRYYQLRDNQWFETSDTEQCDKAHSLPFKGRLIRL